jgi:hypothetical protein
MARSTERLRREPPETLQAREFVRDVKAVTPFLITISIIAMIAGITFAGLGVWLVVGAGETGTSTISILGQTIQTTSVGVACIFIGAIVVLMVLRRVMKSFDILLRR